MVTLELVEKLREKANVSYQEAKEALEKTNGDLLEAMIVLEKERKIAAPGGGGFYSSREHRQSNEDFEAGRAQQKQREETGKEDSATFFELAGRFFRWCGRLIDRGNRNSFVVRKDGARVMTIPVTVLVVLLIFGFWIVVPLIVVGLFLGYRYRFVGPDLGRENVNRALDSAAKAAEDLKKEVKSNHEKPDGEDSDH